MDWQKSAQPGKIYDLRSSVGTAASPSFFVPIVLGSGYEADKRMAGQRIRLSAFIRCRRGD
jgi:hypothetical protein